MLNDNQAPVAGLLVKTHRRRERVSSNEFDAILWRISNTDETATPLNDQSTPVGRKRKTHRRSQPIGSLQDLFLNNDYSVPPMESRQDSPLQQSRGFGQQVVTSPPTSLFLNDSRLGSHQSIQLGLSASPPHRRRRVDHLSPHLDKDVVKVDNLYLPLLDRVSQESDSLDVSLDVVMEESE